MKTLARSIGYLALSLGIALSLTAPAAGAATYVSKQVVASRIVRPRPPKPPRIPRPPKQKPPYGGPCKPICSPGVICIQICVHP